MVVVKRIGERQKMDTYQIITDRIISALEAGTVPWHKPWKSGGMPMNMRGTSYHGMNVFMLHMSCYSCNTWGTFNQIRAGGGMVRKGEHGTPVVFWTFLDKDATETEKAKKIPLLRYFTVFNLEQQDGIALPDHTVKENNPIESAEKILENYKEKPSIAFRPGRAYYRPATDEISVPDKNDFEKVEEYYSTMFHECVHSTGHEKRLDRSVNGRAAFGDETYSKEELVAEMGAAFLSAESGIESKTIDNSAAYIANWLSVLKNDKRMVVSAAGQAQKAADYIMGKKPIETE
jgi:antirestriction protein ArdC